MQNESNRKSEIIALLERRTQVSLENIRQFILDLDERDYMEFLYPSDPDFAEELDERATEAEVMLENLRDIGATLRGLDRGRIKIQSDHSCAGVTLSTLIRCNGFGAVVWLPTMLFLRVGEPALEVVIFRVPYTCPTGANFACLAVLRCRKINNLRESKGLWGFNSPLQHQALRVYFTES
jgi:hypothetical protein